LLSFLEFLRDDNKDGIADVKDELADEHGDEDL
jgi:hypothetical protein